MALTRIPYTDDHFLPVRDFLSRTYDPNAVHPNWQIDRWNFCRHVSQTIHETRESWPATVGLWVDREGEIQAVVNSEGENRGEAFFQLAPRPFTDAELALFLDHAEKYLVLKEDDGTKTLQLHCGPDFRQLTGILASRGYQPGGAEKAGILEISRPLAYTLPEGLSLAEGPGFSDAARGLAHSLAFGYASQGPDVLERYHIVEAFAGMRQAPDYQPALDLALITKEGEVACFACFWFDEPNRIGILEPLGTVPAYQGKGLASALLSEGVNRLRQLGAERLYGGAGQSFYKSFGFRIVDYRQIWQKQWPPGEL